MDTIEIDDKTFLLCDKESCAWNVGHTPGELNALEFEFSIRNREGLLKICKGARAYLIEGLPIPQDCPYKLDVEYLIRQELEKELRKQLEKPDKLIGKIADGARLAKRLFRR